MPKEERKILGGALTDRVFEERYFSDRGIPLITQTLSEVPGDKELPHLTVENHNKWYCAYVIHVDGSVTRMKDVVTDEDEVGWRNHCISPRSFHDTAVHYGLVYDSFTFALVCEMFVEEMLDGDWFKLKDHLPLTELYY